MSTRSEVLHALSGWRVSASQFFPQHKKILEVAVSLVVGWTLWHIPSPLAEDGTHFLATLAAAVTLWLFEVFDEYITALLLLLSWLVFEIIPTETALAGFSKSSWVFVLGALGIGAGVNKSGLLHRLAVRILRCCPKSYKIYTLILAASGPVLTPLLPEIKGRTVILSPLTQAISEKIGFKPRSNGSAGLALSAYVGSSQSTFLFLTGASTCLVGWSLLPDSAKAEFGWATWAVAALPAGAFMILSLYWAIQFLFPLSEQEKQELRDTADLQTEKLGPISLDEWISLAVIAFAVMGWIGKPFHGIDEAWIALGALIGFLIAGVVDKKALKDKIDWGFLLFFGVIYSVGDICVSLKIDRWLLSMVAPVLSSFSFHPIAFLSVVLLLVYFIRIFLAKTPAVIVLSLILMPWGQKLGIHPGVILLTVLMGVETWFLPYQTPSYQIAYCSTDKKAFSHGQGRKLMVAKFVASLLAVIISVPYWTWMGFIEP